MIPDELKTKLLEHCKEEERDMLIYRQLSDEAYAHHLDKVAGVLEDISNDEESHKEALMYLLEMED